MSDVPLAYQDGLVVRGRGLLGHLLEASHWERLMFLTEKDIQSQFQKNLKFANKIDIATDGQHRGRHWKPWKMLSGSRNGQKSGPGAIVRIFGNATEPEALERLNEVGELRLVGRKGRMFHPKVYIFQRPKEIGCLDWQREFHRGRIWV